MYILNKVKKTSKDKFIVEDCNSPLKNRKIFFVKSAKPLIEEEVHLMILSELLNSLLYTKFPLSNSSSNPQGQNNGGSNGTSGNDSSRSSASEDGNSTNSNSNSNTGSNNTGGDGGSDPDEPESPSEPGGDPDQPNQQNNNDFPQELIQQLIEIQNDLRHHLHNTGGVIDLNRNVINNLRRILDRASTRHQAHILLTCFASHFGIVAGASAWAFPPLGLISGAISAGFAVADGITQARLGGSIRDDLIRERDNFTRNAQTLNDVVNRIIGLQRAFERLTQAQQESLQNWMRTQLQRGSLVADPNITNIVLNGAGLAVNLAEYFGIGPTIWMERLNMNLNALGNFFTGVTGAFTVG